MDDAEKATLLYMQELLVTLIKRMTAAGILSEHGSDALAEEVRVHATSKYPQHEARFLAHAAYLQAGIRQEVEAHRARK